MEESILQANGLGNLEASARDAVRQVMDAAGIEDLSDVQNALRNGAMRVRSRTLSHTLSLSPSPVCWRIDEGAGSCADRRLPLALRLSRRHPAPLRPLSPPSSLSLFLSLVRYCPPSLSFLLPSAVPPSFLPSFLALTPTSRPSGLASPRLPHSCPSLVVGPVGRGAQCSAVLSGEGLVAMQSAEGCRARKPEEMTRVGRGVRNAALRCAVSARDARPSSASARTCALVQLAQASTITIAVASER